MNESTAIYKPAIVIPAFRRERSLSRLLQTVNNAHFPADDINLIISIDQGATEEVKQTARSFNFKYGRVQVIEHPEKLGLKDHIMRCADYALEYESVVVLEEDLIVSPAFYTFAQKALGYYENEPSVAGISLYGQRFNESAQLPFEPLQTEYSVYFMKLVCSWGQAWTKKQWQEFKKWYSKTDPSIIEQSGNLPDNINEWSHCSWKKFFNAYIQESEKYFVYPYSSFSTHCGDEEGEHIKEAGNLFQVPLSGRDPKNEGFKFAEFGKHPIKYDMHMEQCGEFINTLLDVDKDNIAVDLYGTKSVEELQEREYILSSKKFRDPIKSFPLQFKPIELNIQFESYNGDPPFFYLYKTEDIISSNFESPNHLRFAKYFSYQNFLSGNIIRSYFKDLFGGGYFK